jgi:predicted TPR repeat methyltransferase
VAVAVAVAVKMTVPWLLTFGLEASADHQMHIHGQYSHAQAYVQSILNGHDFDVEAMSSVVLRREMDEPMQGWIGTAVHRGSDSAV